MAIWTKCLITDVGRNLIANCQANARTLHITNCVSSSHDYHSDAIENLTSLLDIEQTVQINDKTVENSTTVKLIANFDNSTLTTGYDFYTYGIYANDGINSDVLLLVGVTDTPDSVPAVSTAPWQALINTHIVIANMPNVEIQVNPAANATMGWVENYVDVYVTNKLNSVTTITIPIDNWVTETDADSNNYYTREIDVAGMTAEYTGGNSKIDYVRPNPFSINANETALEMYQLLLDVESLEGKIKVTASEIPTTAFQIYLYGL